MYHRFELDGQLVIMKIEGLSVEEVEKEFIEFNKSYEDETFIASWEEWLEEKEIDYYEISPPIMQYNGLNNSVNYYD